MAEEEDHPAFKGAPRTVDTSHITEPIFFPFDDLGDGMASAYDVFGLGATLAESSMEMDHSIFDGVVDNAPGDRGTRTSERAVQQPRAPERPIVPEGLPQVHATPCASGGGAQTSATSANAELPPPLPIPIPAGAKRSLEEVEEAARRAAEEAVEDEEDDDDDEGTGKRRKRATTAADREARSRERNRIHARRSRLRKKFFVDSLKASVQLLQQENEHLRHFIRHQFGKPYEAVVAERQAIGAPTGTSATPSTSSRPQTVPADLALRRENASTDGRPVSRSDFQLLAALQAAHQNFCITDPHLPDNPIVFASRGFYSLTGYTPDEVLGRNCRFLQGPKTDRAAVAKIKDAVAAGEDISVCLLNYRKDGTPFWNQFFVAAIRGKDDTIINYVGVQCAVPDHLAKPTTS